MRRFLLFLSLLAINLVTVSAQKVTSAKKRKKRNKPPPEETEIAGAWLEGCADCNIWVKQDCVKKQINAIFKLPDFVKSELELWQNLGFKDKRGSSKLLLKFHNSLKVNAQKVSEHVFKDYLRMFCSKWIFQATRNRF